MKTNWFKKTGLVYLPTSMIGFLLYAFTLIFCVTAFVAIDRRSHSISDTFYGIFPYFVSAFTILFWIAANTSEQNLDKK